MRPRLPFVLGLWLSGCPPVAVADAVAVEEASVFAKFHAVQETAVLPKGDAVANCSGAEEVGTRRSYIYNQL